MWYSGTLILHISNHRATIRKYPLALPRQRQGRHPSKVPHGTVLLLSWCEEEEPFGTCMEPEKHRGNATTHL